MDEAVAGRFFTIRNAMVVLDWRGLVVVLVVEARNVAVVVVDLRGTIFIRGEERGWFGV